MADESNEETRHQAMPEDLRTSELRYRRLFESARDGILILDAASRQITDVNPFMVELMGYSRDEFLGRELWEIGLFKDKEESRAAFRELQAAGYIRYEDLPLQTKAGKLWHAEFISNVYREDGHHVIQCNIRDITERRRIEERLRQSGQRLRTIFEASHEGIVVEEDERINYVNKSYLRLLGYDDPEELIGQHISVVISPEDAERLLEFGRSRLRGEQSPSEYEFKGRRKDGSLIDVEASVSVSNVADSYYITTMIRDITERHRTEEALRESETRFRAMFEQANVGIVQASFEGRLLVVNPGFCKIIGYAEEEACGMTIRDITHPDDYEREAELTRRLAAGEIPGYVLEKRYIRKDGKIVWGQMTAALIREASGEPHYMLAVVEDITGRKRAEEALRASEHRLQRMVNVPRVGVLTYDHSGALLHANDAFLEMVGHNREEFPAKKFTWRDFTPPEYVEASERVMEQLRETGRGGPYEKEYFRKDGSRMWFMFVAADLGDGTIVEYATDITERKRAEEALKQSHEELHQHTDELERFNRVAVGRELRMIELKKEVNELSRRLGEDQPYPLEFEKGGRTTDE